MAIEDGAVLTRALAMTETIPEALQIYQRNRVDRTARSCCNRAPTASCSICSRRPRSARASPQRDEGEDRNRWLYSYNPLTVALT